MGAGLTCNPGFPGKCSCMPKNTFQWNGFCCKYTKKKIASLFEFKNIYS